jgi:hypothetical protein
MSTRSSPSLSAPSKRRERQPREKAHPSTNSSANSSIDLSNETKTPHHAESVIGTATPPPTSSSVSNRKPSAVVRETTKRRPRDQSDHQAPSSSSTTHHPKGPPAEKHASSSAGVSQSQSKQPSNNNTRGSNSNSKQSTERPSGDYRTQTRDKRPPTISITSSTTDSTSAVASASSPTAKLKASAKEFTPPATSTAYIADESSMAAAAGIAGYESPMWSTGETIDATDLSAVAGVEYTYEQLLQMQMAAAAAMDYSMAPATMDYTSYSSYAHHPIYADPSSIQDFLYGSAVDGSVAWYPVDDPSLHQVSMQPLETTYYPLPADSTISATVPTSYPSTNRSKPRGGAKVVTTLESGHQVVTSKNGTTYFIDPKVAAASSSAAATAVISAESSAALKKTIPM